MAYTEYIHSDIAGKIQLLPLNAIQFIQREYDGNVADRNYVIYNLEAESSFRVTPRTRKHFKQGEIFLGWDLDSSLYVPHNDITEISYINGYIGTYLTNNSFEAVWIFGNAMAWSDTPHTAPQRINSTTGLKIKVKNKRLNVFWSQEKISLRNRHILQIKGFVKRSDVTYEN